MRGPAPTREPRRRARDAPHEGCSGAGPLEAGLRGGRGEAVGWRMGWRRRGALAPLCPHQRLCAASAPLRHLRSVLYYPLVRGRCDHASVTPPSTQCFFFSSGSPLFMSCCQPASKVAHVFLSTHGASLCLWRVGALSTVTSLSCSSIQVMMRPARLPIVRFGPLIPTPWRAEPSRGQFFRVLPPLAP